MRAGMRGTMLGLCALVACVPGLDGDGLSRRTAESTPATGDIRQSQPSVEGKARRRSSVRFDGPRGCGLITTTAWNDDKGTSSIWTIRPNGRSRSRVHTRGTIFNARWSPDARHIGFEQSHGSRYWFHVMEPDGSHETRVTRLPKNPLWDWAPGGRRIAMTTGAWGVLRPIYVVNLEGHRRRLVIGTDPAWSPYGSQIAYSTGRLVRGGGALFLVDVRTKAVQQLTYPVDASDAVPVWSPDGETILFLRYPTHQDGQDGPYADVWSLDLATKTTTRITHRQDDLNGVWGPTWSPDASLITWSPTADGYMETVVSRPDGTHERRIDTHNFYSAHPEWSPDSESIVFDSYVGVNIASADTLETRRILRDAERSWETPDWAPC